jgi:hypothetical protein
MRSIFFIFLFILVPSGMVLSQSSFAGNRSEGQLNINQDERLNDLIRRHVSINEKKEGIAGYRIRIFSESGQGARSRATDVRAKFFNNYPDIDTYLVYDAPNFKVYVGDFRTRSEALKMQRKINRAYPYSFIISDRINLPPID